MTDERQPGNEGSDDLFEDLDTFFKPIEDLDDEAPAIRPPTPNPASSEPPPPLAPDEPETPSWSAGADSSVDEDEEEELLPSGWSAGLVTAGDEAGAPTGPTEEPPSMAMDDLFPAGEGEQAPLRTEPEPPAFSLGGDVDEPQAEPIEAQEWDRFRGALESLDEESEVPAVEPGPGVADLEGGDPYIEATARDDVIEPGAGVAPGPPRSTDEELEDAGITLEDLRSMPSVYRDLPGPDDESDEPPLFAPQVPDATSELDADEIEGAEQEALPEPSEAELEAAAEHFAETPAPSPEDVEEELLADLDREEEGPRTVRVGPEEPVYEEEPEVEPEPRRRVRVGAADPLAHGPSWQDSTGEEVEGGAPAPTAGAGRNIPIALAVAALLAAGAIITLIIGPAAFAYFAGLVLIAAQGEFYAASMRGRRYHPATPLGLIFGIMVLFAAYLDGEAAAGAIVLVSMLFTFLWYMAVPVRQRRNTLASIAITVFGILWIPYAAGFALQLLTVPNEGRALVVTVLAMTFVNDAIAYAAGSYFGGHAIGRPLAASVSPRKSWEGTIVGALGLAVAGMFLVPAVLDIFDGRPLLGLGFGLTIAVAGTFGDLAESLIKRDLKIKDMGRLFPGHGGALDRIDSVLFAAPAAYFFLRLFL